MYSTFTVLSVLNTFQASIVLRSIDGLKLVQGACDLLHFPLVLMNTINKTESAVFYYTIVGSVYF